MMWAFLFTTCLAYTDRHNFQSVMRLTLCTACFACFTSWCCHFVILFILNLLYSILLFPDCKGFLTPWGQRSLCPYYHNCPVILTDATPSFIKKGNIRGLNIQQLLVFATFAGNFFSPFFFLGDFTNTTDIGTCSNWYQPTND